MNETSWVETPKFFAKDLKCCRKTANDKWEYIISISSNDEFNRKINFECVYIKGFIEQKPCDDVMILDDSTGKVKLSNCTQAVQNDCVEKGDYCLVLGKLIREKGLPEVIPEKMICLKTGASNTYLHSKFWSSEVKDFQLFLLGITKPDLNL